MSTLNINPRQLYTAAGTDNEQFNIPFEYNPVEGEILVKRNSTEIASSNYEILQDANENYYIRLVDNFNFDSGDQILLERNTDLTQDLDSRQGGQFSSAEIANGLDKLTLIAQELKRDIGEGGGGGEGAGNFSELEGTIKLSQIPDNLITEPKLDEGVAAKLNASATGTSTNQLLSEYYALTINPNDAESHEHSFTLSDDKSKLITSITIFSKEVGELKDIKGQVQSNGGTFKTRFHAAFDIRLNTYLDSVGSPLQNVDVKVTRQIFQDDVHIPIFDRDFSLHSQRRNTGATINLNNFSATLNLNSDSTSGRLPDNDISRIDKKNEIKLLIEITPETDGTLFNDNTTLEHSIEIDTTQLYLSETQVQKLVVGEKGDTSTEVEILDGSITEPKLDLPTRTKLNKVTDVEEELHNLRTLPNDNLNGIYARANNTITDVTEPRPLSSGETYPNSIRGNLLYGELYFEAVNSFNLHGGRTPHKFVGRFVDASGDLIPVIIQYRDSYIDVYGGFKVGNVPATITVHLNGTDITCTNGTRTSSRIINGVEATFKSETTGLSLTGVQEEITAFNITATGFKYQIGDEAEESGLVNKENSKSFLDIDQTFTQAEKTKLGIVEQNVQSDWDQSTNTEDDFIKNKPTIPSELSELGGTVGVTQFKDDTITEPKLVPAIRSKLERDQTYRDLFNIGAENDGTYLADLLGIKDIPSIAGLLTVVARGGAGLKAQSATEGSYTGHIPNYKGLVARPNSVSLEFTTAQGPLEEEYDLFEIGGVEVSISSVTSVSSSTTHAFDISTTAFASVPVNTPTSFSIRRTNGKWEGRSAELKTLQQFSKAAVKEFLDVPTIPTTRPAADITVDSSGFDGNLETIDNTVQKALQKLDDLDISSGGGGGGGEGADLDFITWDGGASGHITTPVTTGFTVYPLIRVAGSSGSATAFSSSVSTNSVKVNKAGRYIVRYGGSSDPQGTTADPTRGRYVSMVYYLYIKRPGSSSFVPTGCCNAVPGTGAATEFNQQILNIEAGTEFRMHYRIWAGGPVNLVHNDALIQIIELAESSGGGSGGSGLTAAQLSKLNGIASGAEVNVKSDWNQSVTTHDAFIENKPTTITSTQTNKLSGIETGADVNVKSNWDESDSNSDAFIQNKPTIPTVPTTRPATAITVSSSGFDGNLATTDNTVQKALQKLDDLDISSGDGGNSSGGGGFTNFPASTGGVARAVNLTNVRTTTFTTSSDTSLLNTTAVINGINEAGTGDINLYADLKVNLNGGSSAEIQRIRYGYFLLNEDNSETLLVELPFSEAQSGGQSFGNIKSAYLPITSDQVRDDGSIHIRVRVRANGTGFISANYLTTANQGITPVLSLRGFRSHTSTSGGGGGISAEDLDALNNASSNGGDTLIKAFEKIVPDPENLEIIEELNKSGSIDARIDHTMVGDENSGIIFGGSVSGVTSNDFVRYVVSGNTVTLTTLSKSGSIDARIDHTMVGDATSGIIFGGSGVTTSNDFVRYVVSGNTVTLTTLSKSGSIVGRRSHNMVGDENSGIIFGGYDGSSFLNDFVRYVVSGSTVTLTTLSKSGSISARYNQTMVGDATSGIIFGGDDNLSALNDFIRYVVSGSTVTLTTLSKSGSIDARYNHTMVGDATSGIIFGGYDGSYLNDFVRYVVSGSTVTLTEISLGGDLPSTRRSHAMVGDLTGFIIFGGYDGSSFLNDFYLSKTTTDIEYVDRKVTLKDYIEEVTNGAFNNPAASNNANVKLIGRETDPGVVIMTSGHTFDGTSTEFFGFAATSGTVQYRKAGTLKNAAGEDANNPNQPVYPFGNGNKMSFVTRPISANQSATHVEINGTKRSISKTQTNALNPANYWSAFETSGGGNGRHDSYTTDAILTAGEQVNSEGQVVRLKMYREVGGVITHYFLGSASSTEQVTLNSNALASAVGQSVQATQEEGYESYQPHLSSLKLLVRNESNGAVLGSSVNNLVRFNDVGPTNSDSDDIIWDDTSREFIIARAGDVHIDLGLLARGSANSFSGTADAGQYIHVQLEIKHLGIDQLSIENQTFYTIPTDREMYFSLNRIYKLASGDRVRVRYFATDPATNTFKYSTSVTLDNNASFFNIKILTTELEALQFQAIETENALPNEVEITTTTQRHDLIPIDLTNKSIINVRYRVGGVIRTYSVPVDDLVHKTETDSIDVPSANIYRHTVGSHFDGGIIDRQGQLDPLSGGTYGLPDCTYGRFIFQTRTIQGKLHLTSILTFDATYGNSKYNNVFLSKMLVR